MSKKNPAPRICQDCPSKEKGIFCGLNDPDLMALSEHKIENTYKKGQTLFVEGNPSYGIYCVSKGNIKISKLGENGKEIYDPGFTLSQLESILKNVHNLKVKKNN